MLRIGICCWISEQSQLPELRRCLDSVKDYDVILVDGKWYDIESDQESSVQEAIDLIRSYPNVTMITAINRHEWENRNLYLERCTDKDVLIVLDTDEWIEINDLNWLNVGGNFTVGFRGRGHGSGIYKSPRGIWNPSECRYNKKHNEIVDSKGVIKFEHHISDVIINHDKSFRSEERENKMKVRNKLRPFR